MQTNLAMVDVDSETFGTKGGIQRDSSGRFTEGTCGGPGGARPGSGRRPQPTDETLLKRLYDLLDGHADKALQVLVDQLEHRDPKVAQKAASIILSKTLPEGRLLKNWEQNRAQQLSADLESVASWLAHKREQDLAEGEKKHSSDESKNA